MHFKFKHLQKIVGGFFLLTVIIIFILLVIVARGQRWFQEYVHYFAYFNSAVGIHQGSDILIKGLQAGKVKNIDISEDDQVRMELAIFDQYASRIKQGSIAKITKPVVGSATLEIVLGPSQNKLIPKKGTIESQAQLSTGLDNLIDNTNNLVNELKAPEGDLMKTLVNVNVATKGLADAVTKNDGTIRMLLEKRELYDELTSSVKHMDKVLSALDDSSPEIRDAITEARRGLEEVNKVVLALQKSIFLRGNVEKLLKEDTLLRNEGR